MAREGALCIVKGAEDLPLCGGTCAKQGLCIERNSDPLSALIASLGELRMILQQGTVTIDKIHELGADGPAEEAWMLFYDEILPLMAVLKSNATTASTTPVAEDTLAATQAGDVKVISIGHGATLQRQAKTTGAVGWLMYNEHGLVRSLDVFETQLVESALAAMSPTTTRSE